MPLLCLRPKLHLHWVLDCWSDKTSTEIQQIQWYDKGKQQILTWEAYILTFSSYKRSWSTIISYISHNATSCINLPFQGGKKSNSKISFQKWLDNLQLWLGWTDPLTHCGLNLNSTFACFLFSWQIWSAFHTEWHQYVCVCVCVCVYSIYS